MKKYTKLMSLGISLVFAGLFFGACSDDDNLEGVDLRYEDVGKKTMQDLYTIGANDQTPIEFRVKSDHSWKVYGSQDWYSISPNEGVADEVATVKIVCKENTELDDRRDEIKIQSDYWIGKTFTLLQKGIAYLRADVSESGLQKEKESGTATFVVAANQPWTAEVTEGANWLQITENASGGANKVDAETTVKLSFEANKGEERVGKITLYDRNHSEDTKVEIVCTQFGITLIPTIPAIGYYKVVNYQESELEIPVESNGEWGVYKENEGDDWYSFQGSSSFNGNGTIKVKLQQNDLTKVRVVNLVLKTKEAEGAEVVTKYVKIKQANLPQPERTVMNGGGISLWDGAETVSPGTTQTLFDGTVISKSGFKPGTFKLHISEMKAANSHPYLYLEYISATEGTQHEIRIALNDGANPYWTFVTPWGYTAPSVSSWFAGKYGALDFKKDHTLELRLSQYEEAGVAKDAIKIEYIFDNNLAHWFVTDGVLRTGTPSGQNGGNPAYVQPYKSTMRVKLGCVTSPAYFDWFEYTPNVDWGD